MEVTKEWAYRWIAFLERVGAIEETIAGVIFKRRANGSTNGDLRRYSGGLTHARLIRQ